MAAGVEMKIKFEQILLNLEGQPIEEGFTLKKVAITAMTTAIQGEVGDGESSFRRYGLALKISLSDPVEVTPEEVVLLKTWIGKLYGPLAVGRAYEILNKGGEA